ncbi:MAG: CTP pyrophosphohydrolase [Pelotomaculum sp. PtaB.Bin104]|nr:MAG: CTP pyrophosphohydrolase [Pelotomaculum sp. PtaB.Bin104]
MKDVAAAIMINDKDRVFIARRAPGEKHAGGWEFPGGKIEYLETPQECLQRELFEELGITARVKNYIAESIYEYPKGAIRLLAYRVDLVGGDIRLSVHDAYHWVDIRDLLSYDLLPADIPIARKLVKAPPKSNETDDSSNFVCP